MQQHDREYLQLVHHVGVLRSPDPPPADAAEAHVDDRQDVLVPEPLILLGDQPTAFARSFRPGIDLPHPGTTAGDHIANAADGLDGIGQYRHGLQRRIAPLP